MKTISTLVLGVLLAVSAWAAPAAGTGRYDQQIQQDVTKALTSKDKWQGITASVDDGIVTLQGSAKVLIDKLDAQKKAGKVEHVAGVRNQVEVSSTASDEQLQKQLSDKLRYDRVGYGIAFNALALKVENGVATISGDVRDYPARDSAVAIAATTPGVKEVVDNINVLPTSPMDAQKPIRIVVDNGHVTLYGVVDNQMDKQIAEMQAKSVPNVFSVDDKLVVAGGVK
jgi:osmotically-inducible protein OsmY